MFNPNKLRDPKLGLDLDQVEDAELALGKLTDRREKIDKRLSEEGPVANGASTTDQREAA